MKALTESLWAITCYFSPLGSESRLTNYRTFRRHLTIPLIAVELANSNDYQLSDADADILIHVSSPDVLWQKERLLNLALKAVPPDCRHIAWFDCDIVLERPDWPSAAVRALDRYPVVQLFREVRDLPRGALPRQAAGAANGPTRDSLAHFLSNGADRAAIFATCGGSLTHGYSAGQAWAARREVLEDGGFYDARILGSGNKVMVSAAYGHMHDSVRAYGMNPREAEHYLAWATRHFQAVRGNVGSMEGRIYHLWHGDLSRRNYATRYADFQKFDFNPYHDIALNDHCCWRWNTPKPAMHEYVIDYFQSRRDDG